MYCELFRPPRMPSPPGQKFLDPDQPEFKPADLDYCLEVDRFDFVMLVEHKDDRLVMTRSEPA